ncbi:hypothetical protein, variant [Aphanomyces invadans]|nr:hypothetical protein, variant [Aphanomyces invadans]ETV96452.1 hypothetical protein, variant [Aphanomyces invadans]|eukprot:XP_008874715.1 hypothetical protein, variant [Aphanomyces invadans]
MSTDGWSSGHNDDAHPSELEGMSDDDGEAGVECGSSAAEDEDGSSVPDVFEEFHSKSSQRINVLLRQTDDKVYHMYMMEARTRSDRDCFEQWASAACYLRVQGYNGLDGSGVRAPTPLPACVAPLARSSARNSATPFDELHWRSSCLQIRGHPIPSRPTLGADHGASLHSLSDEEVFASHGILDEMIYKHVQAPPHQVRDHNSPPLSPRGSPAIAFDEDAIDSVAPKFCLVQQVYDAVLERLWMHVTCQFQPLLRHVLRPLSAPPHSLPSRMPLTKPIDTVAAAPRDPGSPPVVTSSARLKLVLPRQRNL